MVRKKMAVLCALVLLPALAAVAGGRKWTLSECIDHAARHNISIRTGRLSVMSAGEDVKEAKARLFPSLSFSTTHQGSYRPFAGGSTDKGSYLGDYGLNAAWTVWDGNANRNTLKQQKIVGRQEELNLEENLNSLQEQILQLYVQVLYVGEAVKVDSVILGISRLNAERGAEMYKVGSLSKADLAQLEAQAANDEYNLVNMQGRLEDYKQQLKYLLRLDYDEDFDVAVPPSTDSQAMAPVPTAGEVLANALDDRPEIRNALLDIDRSSVGIDIAKAGRMPTVSLSGGIGTNTATGVQGAWAGQMKDNLSGSVGVTLSVPVFDNRAVKTSVNKAKISLMQSKAEAEDAKNSLALDIQGFWINATTNQERFRAAVASVESAQASYDLLSEQFRLGLKNIVELNNAKATLLDAQQSRLESKYTAILYLQLLHFYNGEGMNMM